MGTFCNLLFSLNNILSYTSKSLVILEERMVRYPERPSSPWNVNVGLTGLWRAVLSSLNSRLKYVTTNAMFPLGCPIDISDLKCPKLN